MDKVKYEEGMLCLLLYYYPALLDHSVGNTSLALAMQNFMLGKFKSFVEYLRDCKYLGQQ